MGSTKLNPNNTQGSNLETHIYNAWNIVKMQM